jgi:hypothetical protein
MATVDNTLDHLETSIGRAQSVLDHAQKAVTDVDHAHQRVEHLATVLRHAGIGLIVGGVLLVVLVRVQRHRRSGAS